MTNLWITPHLGEMTQCLESLRQQGFAVDMLERNSKWACPPLGLQLQRCGAGQESIRKLIPEILASSYQCVCLLGIAGALDPDLRLGDVLIQGKKNPPSDLPPAPTGSTFLLSPTVVGHATDRDDLFAATRMQAVVMESFWSDPELRPLLLKTQIQFHELRVISDHCDQPDWTKMKAHLPAWMNAACRQALLKLAPPGQS